MYYVDRAHSWEVAGKYVETVSDLRVAVELDPKNVQAHNSMAWMLATCPDESFRDGVKALELATKANALSDRKNQYVLGTLAAAYAESGDFQKAVEWQEKALELAPDEQKDDFRSRLVLYKSGKPYRQKADE